jgi:hypothetical protein
MNRLQKLACLLALAALMPLSAAPNNSSIGLPSSTRSAPSSRSSAAPAPSTAAQQQAMQQPQQQTSPQSLTRQAILDPNQAYTRPGNVAFQDGQWVGNDHLYNLTNRIGLIVEIISPEQLLLTPVQLREILAKKLEASSFEIIPLEPAVVGGVPPFLHVLVMAYPREKELVAYVGLRLFEPIELLRIKQGRETIIQGITWERQTVIEANNDVFVAELKTTIDELVNTFIEKWKYFEKIRTRPRMESPLLP